MKQQQQHNSEDDKQKQEKGKLKLYKKISSVSKLRLCL
jgi:hypothetical protein